MNLGYTLRAIITSLRYKKKKFENQKSKFSKLRNQINIHLSLLYFLNILDIREILIIDFILILHFYKTKVIFKNLNFFLDLTKSYKKN